MIIDYQNLTDIIKYDNNIEYNHFKLKLNDYQTKKVAVLYCGHIRSFLQNYENHIKFYDRYFKDYDLFYQLYDNDYLDKFEKVKHLFKDGVIVNNKLDFNIDEKYNGLRYGNLYNFVHQLYGLNKAFLMFQDYQIKNNIFYENVVKMRYDFIFKPNCQLNINNNQSIQVPYDLLTTLSDKFAIGKQYLMNVYFNMFHCININLNPIMPEYFIKDVLTLNRIKFEIDYNIQLEFINYCSFNQNVIYCDDISLFLFHNLVEKKLSLYSGNEKIFNIDYNNKKVVLQLNNNTIQNDIDNLQYFIIDLINYVIVKFLNLNPNCKFNLYTNLKNLNYSHQLVNITFISPYNNRLDHYKTFQHYIYYLDKFNNYVLNKHLIYKV